MSQRGGDVQSNLRISSSPIASDLIALGTADLVVSLEPMEALRYVEYLKPEGWIVTSTAPFINIPNYPEPEVLDKELKAWPHTVAFDMDQMAKDVATARASNMVLLGAAAPFTGMEIDKIEEGIRTIFQAKGEAIVDMNIRAFRSGVEYARKIDAQAK